MTYKWSSPSHSCSQPVACVDSILSSQGKVEATSIADAYDHLISQPTLDTKQATAAESCCLHWQGDLTTAITRAQEKRLEFKMQH